MLKYHHIHSETSHYLYTYLSFLQLIPVLYKINSESIIESETVPIIDSEECGQFPPLVSPTSWSALAGSCLGPSTYSFCPLRTVPLNTLAKATNTWSDSNCGAFSSFCLLSNSTYAAEADAASVNLPSDSERFSNHETEIINEKDS